MNTKPLLSLLADGQVHSGESLADTLGISRTAIWKQVKKLQEGGVQVSTIRGRGYQLGKPMDLLSDEGILSALNKASGEYVSLRVYDSIDSTNNDISRRWQDDETGILVSIADAQEQGRGRRGRPWQSPVGQNLYMSLGLNVTRSFTELDGLSLVAGVALQRALEGEGLEGGLLKWPNDILVGGRKLAGILIELQGELEGSVRVIIGIGINVHMAEAPSVDQPWTSLQLANPGVSWKRNRIAASVIGQLIPAVRKFQAEGFGPFRESWNRSDTFAGRQLTATSGELSGEGCGVDTHGNYVLKTADGRFEKVHAGEISLRVSS
ncbi:BirA family transcriptional regulator, biotin operon repressor / biotin-[acetyl-CoA-carboxylase] ligase [Marinobacter daqiaonensis]|uniref:Bifunctional ligase/repressor BirA n=1 Tax=Marinobacter daqiaonensis TaxID=650891 RepID=A0A1I6K8K5_9GAMM|nr:biotin--[acetyl-CoA-carboxylase] ligase [Marinobacter daqiaonensis]SFR87549.1 BirA family transcriptional regulator, biotin operon repressor / biotin-[acetyl-CoA-carboxylase] ligase [Marinobacter daqiaonensis]